MTDLPGNDDEHDPNPFGDMADGLNQIFQLFGSGGLGGTTGAPDWERARQSAGALASEGRTEPNVDPLVRMQFEQLARVAELQVAEVTGLTLSRTGGGLTVSPVNRTQWAAVTVDAYRPLFEKLAASLGRMMTGQLDELTPDDVEEMSSMMPPGIPFDMATLMAGISGFIGPMMLITMAGSTVGQLGTRAFGAYDLPIPRPPSDELVVVATAIDEFGKDWSLPLDDLRLCICLSEMAHHAVLSQPHVRERLNQLLAEHANGFEADAATLEERLGPLDLSDPAAIESLQSSLGNPDFMLSAIRSDHQRQILPLIDTLVGCIEGYVDWVLDTVGGRLLTSYPMVSESLRRRRVETSQASRFVERLFGMELTQDKIDLGSAFIDGVFARAGRTALTALWSDAEHLPTANELAAPGLWLARVGLADDDQPLPELDGDPGIPDFPDLDK